MPDLPVKQPDWPVRDRDPRCIRRCDCAMVPINKSVQSSGERRTGQRPGAVHLLL